MLEYIRGHREARAEELAEALGITPVAIRRHLDNLRADGLIDARSVRQSTGRPFYSYFLTEAALGEMPQSYAGLLERVLRSVEGREDVTESVASQMAESVASRHRSEIAGSPQERIVQVTESLKSEGILDSWNEAADGYHLVNGMCPYRKAAEVSKLPCESDRRAIELLAGAGVIQLSRIVDGAPICEYLVMATATPAGAGTTAPAMTIQGD